MKKDIQTTANRIEWIDLAKGLGVILVILGHMDLGEGITYFIYSFHMPLFFFLSGMVFHVREGERFRDFAVRKAKALLIPYVLLGIPLLISEYIKAIYSETLTAQITFDWVIKFVLQRRVWTLWFLTALFVCELLMYGIVQRTRGQRLLLSALLSAAGVAYCMLIGIPVIWNVDMALCAMLWMDAGYEWRNSDLYDRIHSYSRERLFAAGVFGLGVCLICSLVSKEISGQTLMMSYNQYGMPVLTYAGAFGGILMVAMMATIFTRCSSGWQRKPLTYIGRNTWIYFAWNQTMMLPLINWAMEKMGYPAGEMFTVVWWIHRLIEFGLVMLFSTICTMIVNKVKQTG